MGLFICENIPEGNFKNSFVEQSIFILKPIINNIINVDTSMINFFILIIFTLKNLIKKYKIESNYTLNKYQTKSLRSTSGMSSFNKNQD